MYFWEGSTNTIQLKCSMLTPILFDIVAITGLPPNGEIYNPNLESETQFKFDIATYGAYMNEHFDKDTTEVYDEEYIAFLTFWLCHCVFCSSSLQIAKKFVIMVIQIHEGHVFNLSKLLLGSLYGAIGTACQTMNTLAEGKTLVLSGPWWLLQLWLVATFEKRLKFYTPPFHNYEINGRRIKGVRLANLKKRLTTCSTVEIFSQYFNVFSNCDTFESTMAHFADCKLGPKCFQRDV